MQHAAMVSLAFWDLKDHQKKGVHVRVFFGSHEVLEITQFSMVEGLVFGGIFLSSSDFSTTMPLRLLLISTWRSAFSLALRVFANTIQKSRRVPCLF